MDKQVSIIIVTYNNTQTIEPCLASIKNQKKVEYQIIVVDNNSADDTVNKIKKYNLDCLVERKTNSGFAKAANDGARVASSSYLLFLNPDAELKDNAIWELLKTAEEDSQVGLVGGKFLSQKGKPMVSFGHFPSRKTEFFQKTRLAKIFPAGRYIPYTLFSKHLFKRSHRVDWVSGGFCLVRKDVFQEVGGFDENFFLYLEDVDLAKKIKERGYRIVFCSTAEAIHHQHRSSSEISKKYEKESLQCYQKKWKKKS